MLFKDCSGEDKMRKVQIVLVVVLMIVGIAGVSFAGGLYIRLGGGYVASAYTSVTLNQRIFVH